MSAAMTLFQLRGDAGEMFDGSVNGISILKSTNARVRPADAGIVLDGGLVDIARHKDLDALQSFTVEGTVTPTKLGTRQNILEGQNPALALLIEADGRLVGTVHTAAGWSSVNSGAARMKAGTAQLVTFTRDANGKLELFIDNKSVGTTTTPGPIQNVGTLGLRVGMGLDNKNPFAGTVKDLGIRQGVVTQQFFAEKKKEGLRLEGLVRQAGIIRQISVNLLPDTSHARLQHVKDIMNAAGVETIGDLDSLQVKQSTVLARGSVLLAPRKNSLPKINWGEMIKTFRAGDTTARRELLAAHLTNRNSAALLTKLPAREIAAPAALTPATTGVGTRLRFRRAATTATSTAASALGHFASLRVTKRPRNVAEMLHLSSGKLTAIDHSLVPALKTNHPWLWPTTSHPAAQVMDLKTIPLNDAVVIAGTLDLTETQLVMESNVETLYIIAETVICGNSAAITWRRPGGTTPGRADDPDLNGRDFPGIQTKQDSRDGIDGTNGGNGNTGIAGAAGRNAPKIEMWVKNMSGLPNLDFNGEDGIVGGRGQRGGKGGDGGHGDWGRKTSFIATWCSTDPGDGGNGGNGGRGGDGGQGGNGGNGGSISIGVLTGTLADTVVNRTFKLKNQGGRSADGGTGGSGGAGGRGGRSGNGEVCTSAKNGHDGAQGQPGAQGPTGFASGSDAQVTFLEFTQEAWDDLMTRPWITAITPPEAFPGDTLVIRGSRFTANDRVMIGGSALTPTVNPDESISVTIPLTIGGGQQTVFVRRNDGTESNRIYLGIKPELDPFTDPLTQGSTVTLNGKAFLTGATVLLNGDTIPATVADPNQLSFAVPGTGGAGSAGGTVSVQVRNSDGRVSNSRTTTQPRVLEIPFRYGENNLSFPNFTDGLPDWGTYEDTFGTAEVLHEQLDPVFGHPLLTAAYYGFYYYFLKGEGHGGLATGFCTSLASLVADRFWLGEADTPAVQLADVQKMLTGVHGKLLSRQSLLTFHDQGREGLDRVEKTYREIEATFLRGTDRQNAPLIFFIPSGEVWDSGYFDKLSDSHCVMPYKFVYPDGHPAPQLTPDGSSTVSDPDDVQLFVWDCNHPTSPNCKLHFHREDGKINFEYLPDSATPEFKSQDGITLGMMRHGDYMLADHDLPFSGSFGLTAFIIDFLLSPADLQITDANGLRTGNFGGQFLSEIPGSHPAYLMKGLYLLPADTALNRTIVGTDAGTYDYNSITPDGTSIVLQGVATQAGQQDLVSISSDATQIRFTPAVEKSFTLSIARMVDTQARAIAISGVGGGPGNDVDITLSPELNLLRVGNRGTARNLEVSALAASKGDPSVNKTLAAIAVPPANDLAVTVTDWTTLDLEAQAVPFE